VSRPELSVALDPSDDLMQLAEELSQDAVLLASVQAQKGIMCPIEIDLKCACHPFLPAALEVLAACISGIADSLCMSILVGSAKSIA
jgi:hypothetical protein